MAACSTRCHLLLVEKGRVIDALRRGALSRESYDALLADVDARLLELESDRDEDRESRAEASAPAAPDRGARTGGGRADRGS
jgi:hypothetical protein